MIDRLERWMRGCRRRVSRSEWAIRRLGLSKGPDHEPEPGLVMIQIDGFSHTQLQKALATGRMPFLRRLLEREHYTRHSLYSGLPSSTPSVQGELFYGVPQAVPAFSFLDREAHRMVRMWDHDPAAKVEARLAAQGEPLLTGGSAYCDIYTGGAAESHFCPSSLGWSEVWRAVSPVSLAVLLLSHAGTLLRTVVLIAIEFVLAFIDCLRGLIEGRDLIKELKFIPTRAGICILMREWITLGAKIDVVRGLPVVHVNYLGYDEQAHRRGPSSAFAHWALKGIDASIHRIWHSSHRSIRRHYDIWVYSDHGQEETLPYPTLHDCFVHDAVAHVFDQAGPANPIRSRGEQFTRLSLLGRRWNSLVDELTNPDHDHRAEDELSVAAMGPVGVVYDPIRRTPQERETLAMALVTDAHVPVVLVPAEPGHALAFTADGRAELPRDRAQILGADHPFLDAVGEDLVGLCHHPDAGDYLLLGWRGGFPPVSFPIENGSHAGPGSEETGAFALLPADTPLPPRDTDYLRIRDLRAAAFRVLRPDPETVSHASRDRERNTLRIMTYNVHSCIGMDGRIAPERIARIIALHDVDIAALQELDASRPRTGDIDQAHLIARHLDMDFHFHPAIHVEEEQYGDAIITHLPVRLVKTGILPPAPGAPSAEPRGALWVQIETPQGDLQLINTHLGLRPRERIAQAEALLNGDWLSHPDCRSPRILCGDFNAMPSSPVCKRLNEYLVDAQQQENGPRPRNTFFGRMPTARIDHIYTDPGVRIVKVEVPQTALTRVASDHLPLIVEIALDPKGVSPRI